MTDTSGPAFPVETYGAGVKLRGVQTGPETGWHTGMTVREYAAIAIAAGLCANPDAPRATPILAADAVRMADALLAELRK